MGAGAPVRCGADATAGGDGDLAAAAAVVCEAGARGGQAGRRKRSRSFRAGELELLPFRGVEVCGVRDRRWKRAQGSRGAEVTR